MKIPSMRHWLLVFLLSGLQWPFLWSYGQDVKTVRLEIPADMDADSYRVIPLDSTGLLIFYASNELDEKGQRNWYFGHFNTNLKQEWIKFVAMGDPITYVDRVMHQGFVHMLFRSTGRGGRDYDYYQIVNYDMRMHTFSLISGTLPEDAEVAAFAVTDRRACLALNLPHDKADLLFVNLITGDVVPEHMASGDDAHIMALAADPPGQRFVAAVKTMQDGRYMKDKVVGYSPDGKLKQTLELKADDNTRMLRTFALFPDQQGVVITGTYDLLRGRLPSLKDLREEPDEPRTAGYYMARFKGGEQVVMRYDDFITFGTGELPPGYSDSLKLSQREKLNFVHVTRPEGMVVDGHYILLSESYSPYYKTETRMDYDYYGRAYPYTYRVFAGYAYGVGIVAAFDENGQRLWDNVVTLDNLMSYKLHNHLLLVNDPPYHILAWARNGKIAARAYEGNELVTQEETPVAGTFARDRILNDEDNHLVYWYDKYYLLWGDEQIRNRSLSAQDERTVFYVNKVAFR